MSGEGALGDTFQYALQAHDAMKPRSALWQKWLWSSVGVSVVVMVLSAVLLYAINPPMVQSKAANDLETPNRDFGKIAGWSLAAGVVVLVGPLVYKWVNKEPAGQAGHEVRDDARSVASVFVSAAPPDSFVGTR